VLPAIAGELEGFAEATPPSWAAAGQWGSLVEAEAEAEADHPEVLKVGSQPRGQEGGGGGARRSSGGGGARGGARSTTKMSASARSLIYELALEDEA